MTTEVIAIFDIGKTNKKLLLFNKDLKLISQIEEKFAEITDEDNFSCDDIEKIEFWMLQSVKSIQENPTYNLKAINFSTYGASLAYIDTMGNRLVPIYNYLKPMPADILSGFYEKFGGVTEFSRKTASPALEMLNSGLQILWFKRKKEELYKRVSAILHFPQYLSYLFSKKITSEYTSLGCHTALWNFDEHCYHQWLTDEKIPLPNPVANDTTFDINFNNHNLLIGIGIHDSSSALVPYLEANTEPFVLISTGTWCIIMNPFNDEPLTKEQLGNDALCYMSTLQKQVKSSRVFMGHLHDVYAKQIADYYKFPENNYKTVCANEQIIKLLISQGKRKRVFLNNDRNSETGDMYVDYSQFSSYEEAYHQLVFDLTLLIVNALNLVLSENDSTQCIYITGGFARNEIFVRSLTTLLPNKKLFTSEIDNASALGAAMVIWHKVFNENPPKFELGLKKVEAITIKKQSEFVQDIYDSIKF